MALYWDCQLCIIFIDRQFFSGYRIVKDVIMVEVLNDIDTTITDNNENYDYPLSSVPSKQINCDKNC